IDVTGTNTTGLYATDNCSGPLTVTQDLPATTIVSALVNQVPVVFTVTDASNNFVTHTVTVRFKDSSLPYFVSFPKDTTIYTSATQCGVNYTWDAPVAGDNCSPDRGQTVVTKLSAKGSG